MNNNALVANLIRLAMFPLFYGSDGCNIWVIFTANKQNI
jgi:hypothetical protein